MRKNVIRRKKKTPSQIQPPMLQIFLQITGNPAWITWDPSFFACETQNKTAQWLEFHHQQTKTKADVRTKKHLDFLVPDEKFQPG